MIDQKQLKLKIDNLINFIELQESLSKENSLGYKIMKNLNFTYPSKMKSIFLKRKLKKRDPYLYK